MKVSVFSTILLLFSSALQALDFTSTKKLAEQGHAVAQLNLGVMYYLGDGVIEDFVASYAWFSNAKANGNKNAPKAISILKEEMTKEQIALGQALAKKLYQQIENRDDESPVHTKYY